MNTNIEAALDTIRDEIETLTDQCNEFESDLSNKEEECAELNTLYLDSQERVAELEAELAGKEE